MSTAKVVLESGVKIGSDKAAVFCVVQQRGTSASCRAVVGKAAFNPGQQGYAEFYGNAISSLPK